MPTRPALIRLLVTSENRAALVAIQEVLLHLTAGKPEELALLYLHGPSGVGKTSLVSALAAELETHGLSVYQVSANDFADAEALDHNTEADLVIVEDLQHLPVRFVPALTEWIDQRRPMIVTATDGPIRLKSRGILLPYRLRNRLAAGLVVALDPMQAPSRRKLLAAQAEQMKLSVAPDILDWLAQQLTGGGRQLEGALRQLKTLQRLQKKPLKLADIREHFRIQVDAKAPTVKRIAEQVGGYFQVESKHLQSARRSRDVLLPRQISLYLARQLTNLSLQSIGKFFGGRDHKTVQHACKKVETVMKTDAVLSSAVRQIHAQLA
jgi:chromosomal replication initiator protein